jgi:DNA invertase Pin-like site-specific DNA recombinase
MINVLRHNVRQVAVSKKPVSGPLIGYARVSTQGQDLAQQRAMLSAAGCGRVFEEKVSGAKRDRPELGRLLDHLRIGDVVTVTRLDRLARSTRDLLEIAERIKDAGAGLRSIAEPWADTTTPAGRMVLTVFAGIADFERSLIVERTSAGRIAAKARGVRFGPHPSLGTEQIAHARQLIQKAGKTVAEVARLLGVHRSTLYRVLDNAPTPSR